MDIKEHTKPHKLGRYVSLWIAKIVIILIFLFLFLYFGRVLILSIPSEYMPTETLRCWHLNRTEPMIHEAYGINKDGECFLYTTGSYQ